MKEELIQKSLEAFLTGAKVLGEEGKLLINEVLNYMMFNAILDIITSLAWGVLGFAVYKIGKNIVENVICEQNVWLKNKELEYEEDSEKAKKEGYKKFGSYYLEQDRNKVQGTIKAVNGIFYSLVFVVSVFWGIKTIEKLRPVGKILTAPRLVLIQEGSHLLKTLKERVK